MPIPSEASTAARAAAWASAGCSVSWSRSGFGRISAMTVSFTIIGCAAPERPALLGMLPISSGMRSRSIAAAANQAVPAQIVRRAAVGSCARFLLLGGRLLQGVPVGQMRRGQSLEKRTDWYYA
ncbi:hypothetical protein [Streptomyces sp. NPDC059122]|uniref:hypothetical protein n=1 Tax=Streptomyces sp. NPDC059122 TaxID=3346732 RepID=UPI0036764137